MRYELEASVAAWALWAPSIGWVINSLQYGRGEAAGQLADRVANGEAFKGERVRRVRVRLSVDMVDGGVSGYLLPVNPARRPAAGGAGVRS